MQSRPGPTAVTLEDEHAALVVRYNRLHEITCAVIEALAPNGLEMLPFVDAGGGKLDLGLERVVALLPEAASPAERDHLVLVHLAAIESHMYGHGHCPTGHLIRIMAGNYGGASEEGNSRLSETVSFAPSAGSPAQRSWKRSPPLKRVTDTQYTDMYEQLISAWGNPPQKKVAEMMRIRLRTIHLLLPRHKIGTDFGRLPKGRQEPLPLYVRNEIHHPTIKGLADSNAFQRDKRIGYAIMAAWLSGKD